MNVDPATATAANATDPLGRMLILAFAIGTIAAGWAVAGNEGSPIRPMRQVTRAVATPVITPPPVVEPLKILALTPEEAVAFNAKIPFSTAANPAAKPLRLKATGSERERATDCLTAAMIYEAGASDADGQRAVAQVVLNRLRHPAFPKSVCAVVFEGSERATGCQFTFTCDGAMQRRPHPNNWDTSRKRAAQMLDGEVYRPVGYATHYHTNWVVPYWSASLEKITAVGTHLFFRWEGWWGTPPAFRRQYSGTEPVISKLAAIAPAHGAQISPADEAGAIALASGPQSIIASDGSFIARLDPKAPADSFAALARETCGIRSYCKFMGWTDGRRAPSGLPISPEALADMSFSYLRDEKTGFEKALWNCAEFKRRTDAECMKSREHGQPVTG